MNGPAKMSREERLKISHEIANRVMDHQGKMVKSIGIYGSIARNTDGPFSDIEMFCVLRSSGESYSYEWSAGLWKAEVDFYSEDVLLQKAAESPKIEDFYRAICDVLVGEIYEFVGKWRNISVRGPVTYLPSLVIEVAKYGAMLVGLHNRTYFSTSAQVLLEALNLPNRPHGFDHLCKMVMSGHLGNSKAIINSCEDFWKGVIDWSIENGYVINHKKKIPF